MKYVLVMLSALIIISGIIFVLNQSKEKVSISADNITKSDNITKAEEIENTAALIKKLKPLVDEVSLKNFQNDDEVYAQYKDKLLMIDTLSEQIIDNIADIIRPILLFTKIKENIAIANIKGVLSFFEINISKSTATKYIIYL